MIRWRSGAILGRVNRNPLYKDMNKTITKLAGGLTVMGSEDECFSGLTVQHQETMIILAAYVWAGDKNVGEGAGNGKEDENAWKAADEYLRAHGLYPEWV